MTTLTIKTMPSHGATKTSAKAMARPGFFSRLLTAHVASRQRKADIEIRRHRALMGDQYKTPDYAMLPFSGE